MHENACMTYGRYTSQKRDVAAMAARSSIMHRAKVPQQRAPKCICVRGFNFQVSQRARDASRWQAIKHATSHACMHALSNDIISQRAQLQCAVRGRGWQTITSLSDIVHHPPRATNEVRHGTLSVRIFERNCGQEMRWGWIGSPVRPPIVVGAALRCTAAACNR
jgi:hypothetical protein